MSQELEYRTFVNLSDLSSLKKNAMRSVKSIYEMDGFMVNPEYSIIAKTIGNIAYVVGEMEEEAKQGYKNGMVVPMSLLNQLVTIHQSLQRFYYDDVDDDPIFNILKKIIDELSIIYPLMIVAESFGMLE